MRWRERRTLQQRRRDIAAEASQRLDAHSPDGIAEQIRKLKEIDEVLALLPLPRWQAVALPAATGLACLLIAWIALTVRISALGLRTEVAFSMDTDTVNMTAAGRWTWKDRMRVRHGRLGIENAALSFSDAPRAFGTLPAQSSLQVEAGALELRQLEVQPGTALTLARALGEDDLQLLLAKGGATGAFLVNSRTSLAWEVSGGSRAAAELSLEVPEEVAFSTGGSNALPARLSFAPDRPLVFRFISVSGMSFGRPLPLHPGEAAFVSGIRSARLRISDVAAPLELSAGEVLALHEFNGLANEILIGDAGTISLVVQGTADTVAIGPPGREREVTPTVLEFLYHNQRLAFLFAAASVVWGALWSLKRVIEI